MLAIEEVEKYHRDNLPPLSLICGDDPGQYEWVKTKFLEQIGYDPADLNNSYYDLREASYEQVELDLVSLPFFADEKVVMIDYFEDLTTSRKRFLSDQELQSFEDYLENPSSSNRLVIFCPGKLDGKRRLVKLLKRDGQVFDCSQVKEAELRTYLSAQADKEGLHFSKEVFDLFLYQSAYQFTSSMQNLALLKAYKGSGQVSQEDVQEALPKSLQDNIFDLSQLILKGSVDAARNLVKDLVLQGEDEVKLLAVLTSQFRTYLQVKSLKERGLSQDGMAQELEFYWGRKVNPYQIKFSLRDADRLSLSYLKAALLSMIQTDYKIKRGQMDKSLALDLLLLELFAKQAA